jgi:hypothetical protein
MRALVVQRVELVLVVIKPGRLVEDQRIRLETVPEAENDIDEFGATLIAPAVRRKPVEL